LHGKGFPTKPNEATAHEDQGTIFAEYRSIPAFREYVLAAADRMAVRVHRRQDDGTWIPADYGAGDVIELESLGVRLTVSALYHKVRLRPSDSR
jgi:Uma2 family endonuclease